MLELEQEIFEPSGISTVEPPKMIMEGVLISKPCGILYHLDGCTGLRYDIPLRLRHSVPNKMLVHGSTIAMSSHVCHPFSQHNDVKSKTKVVDAGWSSIIYLVMLLLLSRQITASRTPAGVSRLSRWTFFAQALIDTITFVIVGVFRYHSSCVLSPETPQLASLAIGVHTRASIPLIAPAALAMVLLVYEMVGSFSRCFWVLATEGS